MMNTARRGRPVDVAARAARRRQILDAARLCFAEKGFHAASTSDISAAADVSVANLYQYFTSKDDLIIAIAEDDLRSDLGVAEIFEQAPDFFNGLRAVAEAFVTEVGDAAQVRLRLEVLTEATRNPQVAGVLARGEAALLARLTPVIARAQARGEVRRDLPASDAALALLSLTDGYYARVVTQADPHAIAERMLSAVNGLLRSPQP
jgi:AcrR family transcriptional regulator